jgi:hypothetical protein
MKRYEISIAIATGYLLIYLILFAANAPLWMAFLLFCLSPIPVIWMSYQILTDAIYSGKDLDANEEFGYQDVNKNTLGFF